MRCSRVEQELLVPTGIFAPGEIDGHLQVCTACKAVSGRQRAFDQLWEGTRPEIPSPMNWDAMWSRIEVARSTEPAPVVHSFVARSRWRFVGYAAAAAAVVGLGLGAWTRWQLPNEMNMAHQPTSGGGTASTVTSLNIPIGQTVLYRVDEAEMRVVQTNESGQVDESLGFHGPDEFLAFYGIAEFLPDLVASNEPSRSGGPAAEAIPQ